MKPALQRRVQRYGWDRDADHCELKWKKQLKPAQDKLLEMTALEHGESILETACGQACGIRCLPAVFSAGDRECPQKLYETGRFQQCFT